MKPVFVGRENIMDFYDSVNPEGAFAYSVWFGNNIVLQYPGDMDNSKAREFLENTLEAYEANGWDKTLWLKFHPAQRNPINKKTDVIICQPIGFTADAEESTITGNGLVVYKGSNSGGLNMEMFRAIKTLEDMPDRVNRVIDEKMTGLETRLKALEDQEQQPEEPSMMAQISGIMEKQPQLVEMAIGFLKTLTDRFTQTIPAPAQPPVINGIPETMTENQIPVPPATETQHQDDEAYNNKLDAALDRLEKVMDLADDLTYLADWAEKNPGQFQILLMELRKQAQ